MFNHIVLFSTICLVSVTAVIYVEGPLIYDSPADKIKDHPGKCYVEELGLFDNSEPVRQGKRCATVKCLPNKNGQFEIRMCPYLAVEPPCYAYYPEDKPFPECCTFEIKCIKGPGVPIRPTSTPSS